MDRRLPTGSRCEQLLLLPPWPVRSSYKFGIGDDCVHQNVFFHNRRYVGRIAPDQISQHSNSKFLICYAAVA